jgi:hypothetical protein
MSFSFYIPMADPPPLSVFEGLGIDGVRCVEELSGDHLPEGYWHFYVEGLSVRAIEVSHEDERLQVRIMTCSAAVDHALAVAIAKAAARQADALIEPEGCDPCSLEELDSAYGQGWIDDQVTWGANVIRRIMSANETVTMSGPRRDFHMGPRLVAELGAAGPPEKFPERLFSAMRRLQYIDEDRYFAANILKVSSKETGKGFTLAVWGPEVGYLFPVVDYLHLVEGEEAFQIPYAVAPTLPGLHVTWLDEKHFLVEPVEKERWGAFCTEARRHAVTNPVEH